MVGSRTGVLVVAKLTGQERKALPKGDFGLPAKRAYPVEDRSHAANAKARASQQAAKGNLSESAKREIDRKADKKLK